MAIAKLKRRSREEIIESLLAVRESVIKLTDGLDVGVSVEKYAHLIRKNENGYSVWTEAFQRAIDENETVIIPSALYYIDKTLVLPSNRKIIAYGAHIRKVPEMNTLLLRNEHLKDGSYRIITRDDEDKNISVIGGTWEDTGREWTFHHGLYDSKNSMVGVSACMCFINVRGLYLSDIKIIRAGGFGIQLGYLTDGAIENIKFENTVADGVHINGHTKNLIVRNVSGSVGDDIIALNMYDWDASSVAFGNIENVLCENICLAPEARYKAIRILPGQYRYKSSRFIESCYLRDVIIKGVRGVNTFKFYFQTPPHKIGEEAEELDGVGDNLFIEDVEIDLNKPIDALDEYLSGDKILGTFAAFEFGSRFGRVTLFDIKAKLYQEKFPTSYLLSIGPKSARRDGKEIFNPKLNSCIEELFLNSVSVNGELITKRNVGKYIKRIVFKNLYGEKSGRFSGKIKKIKID